MLWLPGRWRLAAAIAARRRDRRSAAASDLGRTLVGLGQLRSSVIAGIAFNAGLVCAVSVLLERRELHGARQAAVCAALTGAAVYATGSRSAYLGGAIGVWTLLLLARRGSGAVNALGVVCGAGAVRRRGRTRAADASPRLDRSAVSARRQLPSWRSGPRNGGDWPGTGLWFGLGVLAPDDVVLQGQAFAHPHSLYLASALQGGLVGLLLLLGVLLVAGFNLYRARRLEEARLGLALLAAGMSAYLLDGWELIDKVSVSWLLLWVPVAIAIGVRMKVQNQREIASALPAGAVALDPVEERR